LLLAAMVQGFVYRVAGAWMLPLPWSPALLGHATVAALLAGIVFGRQPSGGDAVQAIRRILSWSALATSAAGVAYLAWMVPVAGRDDLAGHLLWLASV